MEDADVGGESVTAAEESNVLTATEESRHESIISGNAFLYRKFKLVAEWGQEFLLDMRTSLHGNASAELIFVARCCGASVVGTETCPVCSSIFTVKTFDGLDAFWSHWQEDRGEQEVEVGRITSDVHAQSKIEDWLTAPAADPLQSCLRASAIILAVEDFLKLTIAEDRSHCLRIMHGTSVKATTVKDIA